MEELYRDNQSDRNLYFLDMCNLDNSRKRKIKFIIVPWTRLVCMADGNIQKQHHGDIIRLLGLEIHHSNFLAQWFWTHTWKPNDAIDLRITC